MVYKGANGTPSAGLLGEELEEGWVPGTGAVLGGCFVFVVCWALLLVCKVEKNRVRMSKCDLQSCQSVPLSFRLVLSFLGSKKKTSRFEGPLGSELWGRAGSSGFRVALP